MTDIRFVRPITDNKVRNYPPHPDTRDTLHITTPTRGAGQPSSWELFLTSEPHNGIRKSEQSNSQQYVEIKKPPDVFNVFVSGSENTENKSIISKNNDTVPHFNKKSPPVASAIKPSVLKEDTASKGSRSPGWVSSSKISPETQTETECESLTQITCRPDDKNTTELKNANKCPVMQFCKTFGLSGDSSLVDVHDEELDEIPEVRSPTGLISSPAKQYDSGTCKTPCDDKDIDQSHHDTKADPQQPKSQFNPPGRIFKRSVSSFDFEEMPYTSFFGSLRKKGPQVLEEVEEDSTSPDFNFSTPWDMRRARVFESTIHRTQSADSFMLASKKRKPESPTEVHSRTPIQRLNKDDGESDEEDNKGGDDFDVLTNNIDESCDRLRIRRGALAQPERMIISQAVREKVEKDVEKRKASMVRRMSQFFSVQLGLNREEDLI